MKNRYVKLLIVIASFLVLALVTSASYAYFVANVSGNESAFENVIYTGDVALHYDDLSVVMGNNAIPGNSIKKTFMIQNTGNVETTYDVYLSEVINTFVDKNDLVYNLYIVEGTIADLNNPNFDPREHMVPVALNQVMPSEVGDQSRIVTSKTIGVNGVHGYLLEIKFKDDGTNQDDNKGKGFRAVINVNDYKEAERYTNLLDGETFNNTIANYYYEWMEQTLRSLKDELCENRTSHLELSCDEYLEYAISEAKSQGIPFKSVGVSQTPPADSDNAINVASVFSEYPVYAWIDMNDGGLKLYSEDSVIYLNENSRHLFMDFAHVTSIDMEGLDTSKVYNMHGLFENNYKLQNLNLGSRFDTSNVYDMSMMFYEVKELTTLDLGDKFDTSNVRDAYSMFYGLRKLTSLDLGDKFNTINMEDMESMFDSLNALTTLDLGDKFDTRNATNMKSMFASNHALTSLNLGDKFDTSKVTDMRHMFTWNTSIPSIDLGDKFNTSSVVKMDQMFYNCPKMTTIYAAQDFNTSSLTSSSSMFTLSKKLVGGAGTVWNSSHLDATYARIDNPSGNKPGYFTLRTN